MRVVRFFVQPLFLLGRIYWFFVRPRTHGVKCIIEHGGKYLFVRNTYGSGDWAFPGGGVKRNESVEGAVRREVREELGIELDNLKHLGICKNNAEYKKDTIDVFSASTDNANFKRNIWEISEVQWFEKNNLPPVMSSVTQRIIQFL